MSTPGAAATSAAKWVEVCPISELEPFWAEAALIDDVQVAVVLLPGGALHAVSNEDPVTGAFVMSRGIVGSRGDRPTIASPLNKQVYDLLTGECLTADGPGLRVFPIREADGSVQVDVSNVGETADAAAELQADPAAGVQTDAAVGADAA